MSYDYQRERHNVFTEDGQVMFLKIRDRTKKLLDEAGACMAGNMIHNSTGDSWHMLACIDRLVELEEIQEIDQPHCAAQHRIFVRRG